MINVIRSHIIEFLKQAFYPQTHFKFSIEIPAQIKYGDLSTNVMMIYTKENREELSQQLIQSLSTLKFMEKVLYVSPGFINMYLKPNIIEDINYEYLKSHHQENISVEYASPNPTGKCHIGHARGSVIGDIIASVFEYLGYRVRKDFIFNDAGNQVNHFIDSVYKRYLELKGNSINLEDIFYKGDYVIDIARRYEQENLSEKEFLSKREEILELMREDIQDTLSLLHIHHHMLTYESKLQKEKDICWARLEAEGLLERETTHKGTKILFKSKNFDDDKDRVIEREDGTITYFGNDIAYHLKKKDGENFKNQIIILGDDHNGYLRRLASAVKVFDINLHIVTHNLVKIFKNNQEFKMSKRSGVFVTIRDFLENYGNQDLLRILLIEQAYTSVIHLNLNNISFENSSLFYLQYAYARLFSIINKHELEEDNMNLELLNTNEDRKLITLLVYWPEFIENFTHHMEVHSLLMYAKNLAKAIHNYLTNNIIIQNNYLLQNTRLYLMKKCLMLLGDIMNILKITILKEM